MNKRPDTALCPFGWRDNIGYALGDFGCNMSFALINTYLMIFYVNCAGIRAEHFAIIILFAKIFDAVNDPIIGSICDITKPGKQDKFKTWIKWASLPLLISSVLLFTQFPVESYGLKVVLCFILYCIWSIAYTSTNVPYGSLQNVITDVSEQRSSLSTWRSMGSLAAQIPVVIVLPLLIYDEQNNARGPAFFWIALVMGIIGFFSFTGLRKLTTTRLEPEYNKQQKIDYIGTLKAFFSNIPMVGLTIASVAYVACILTLTTSFQYVLSCYYQNSDLISIASVLAAVPLILGAVLVKPMTKRFTKMQLYTYPYILSIAAAGIATFVRLENPYMWISAMALVMTGTAFTSVLTWAMVADCIDYQKSFTGKHEEGTIYATYSLFRKIAQGLGAALIAALIGWAGFDETVPAMQQAAGVPERIYFVTGLVPLVGSIISFVSMIRLYKIEEKKQEQSIEKDN